LILDNFPDLDLTDDQIYPKRHEIEEKIEMIMLYTEGISDHSLREC